MKKLTILLSLLLIFALFPGCSSASEATYDTAVTTTESSASGSAGAPMEAPESAMEEEIVADAENTVDFTEKIVYTAYLDVETREFDQTISDIYAMVDAYDGFLEQANQSGNTVYAQDGTTNIVDRNGYYVLRIPAQYFEEALHQAGSIGNVVSSQQQAENITAAFTDQEARLTSLEIQQERLLTMLEQSTDIETLVALEARLSEVRYEIDSINRTLTNWQRQVDYSTVEIYVYEVESYTASASVQRTFGEKIGDSFQSGMENFVQSCQLLLLLAIHNAVNLVLFIAVVVVVIVVIKKHRKHKRNKQDNLDQ